MGWISVKTRKPDEELASLRRKFGISENIGHVHVIGCVGKIVLENTVEYDGENFWYNGERMNEKLTHWMPLPEPQKEE